MLRAYEDSEELETLEASKKSDQLEYLHWWGQLAEPERNRRFVGNQSVLWVIADQTVDELLV